MVTIIPFKALRPEAPYAKQVAAKPYDVLTSSEAKIEAQGNPVCFLHVTKSEIDLPANVDPYSQKVYDKAKQNLDALKSIEAGGAKSNVVPGNQPQGAGPAKKQN